MKFLKVFSLGMLTLFAAIQVVSAKAAPTAPGTIATIVKKTDPKKATAGSDARANMLKPVTITAKRTKVKKAKAKHAAAGDKAAKHMSKPSTDQNHPVVKDAKGHVLHQGTQPSDASKTKSKAMTH